MKTNQTHLVLLACMLSVISAESNCNLSYLRADYQDWHDLGNGFIAAFYRDPPKNRTDCA